MTENDEQMIRGQMYMISQNRPIISFLNPDTYYFGNYINKSRNDYSFENVMQCNSNRNNFTTIQLGTRIFSSHTYYFVMAPPFPEDGKKKKKKRKSKSHKTRKSNKI